MMATFVDKEACDKALKAIHHSTVIHSVVFTGQVTQWIDNMSIWDGSYFIVFTTSSYYQECKDLFQGRLCAIQCHYI